MPGTLASHAGPSRETVEQTGKLRPASFEFSVMWALLAFEKKGTNPESDGSDKVVLFTPQDFEEAGHRLG
jgi:hypothetical protein